MAGLEADFVPLCRYCGKVLQPVALKLLNFQLNEPAWWERGEKNAYAIDVECWCEDCGYWVPFGVACPKDHWEKVKAEAVRIYGQGTRTKMGQIQIPHPRA